MKLLLLSCKMEPRCMEQLQVDFCFIYIFCCKHGTFLFIILFCNVINTICRPTTTLYVTKFFKVVFIPTIQTPSFILPFLLSLCASALIHFWISLVKLNNHQWKLAALPCAAVCSYSLPPICYVLCLPFSPNIFLDQCVLLFLMSTSIFLSLFLNSSYLSSTVIYLLCLLLSLWLLWCLIYSLSMHSILNLITFIYLLIFSFSVLNFSFPHIIVILSISSFKLSTFLFNNFFHRFPLFSL